MNAEEMSKGNGATKIIRATSTFDCGGHCPLRLPLFLGSGSRVKSKVSGKRALCVKWNSWVFCYFEARAIMVS